MKLPPTMSSLLLMLFLAILTNVSTGNRAILLSCCKLLAILAATYIMLLVYNFCKLKAAGRLKLLQADSISKLVATYFSCLHLQDSSF